MGTGRRERWNVWAQVLSVVRRYRLHAPGTPWELLGVYNLRGRSRAPLPDRSRDPPAGRDPRTEVQVVSGIDRLRRAPAEGDLALRRHDPPPRPFLLLHPDRAGEAETRLEERARGRAVLNRVEGHAFRLVPSSRSRDFGI